MKNKKLIVITAFTVVFICISARSVVKSPCDSPIVGDHSGAPGETNCSGCHSAPVNPNSPDLHFEFENNNTLYQLDSSYLVHIRIRRSGHSKFGFVCSALDTTNTSVGTFSLVNSSFTRTYILGGRRYISHTPCGADNQDSAVWTYKWKAPTLDKGKVKIYMSMLVANHDEALTGDTTYTRVLEINPPNMVNIKNNQLNAYRTKVKPTVFSDNISLEFNPKCINELKIISIYDMQGKLILKNNTRDAFYDQTTEGISEPGVYLLKIEYPKVIENYKVIKQ